MLPRPAVPEDGEMHTRRTNRRGTPGHTALVAAGVLGIIHAGFSLFWALGGTWLLWSLGSGLLQTFEGREWILFPVGVVKLVAAVTPLALVRWGWPAHRITRSACWVGASVLILWGGLNTVVGNLVLSGLIRPSEGYDRSGMIGHAWMWDPLFLAWGVALVIGLVASGRGDRVVPQPVQLQPARDL